MLVWLTSYCLLMARSLSVIRLAIALTVVLAVVSVAVGGSCWR
jgi:hypothetical protein